MIYGYLSVMIKHDSIHSLRVAVPPPRRKNERKEPVPPVSPLGEG